MRQTEGRVMTFIARPEDFSPERAPKIYEVVLRVQIETDGEWATLTMYCGPVSRIKRLRRKAELQRMRWQHTAFAFASLRVVEFRNSTCI